jgi:Tol biopolymer transport system component
MGFAGVILVGLCAPACSSSGSSRGGSSGSSGASGSGDGDGGAGSSGSASGGAPGAEGALPASAFLYLSRNANGDDTLVAYDAASGEAGQITDFRGDGSEGHPIDGVAISPDRTRIAVASLYAGTHEDVATGLAANRITTFAVDGSDFRRLTPVWKNTGAGRTNFAIQVSNPAFSKDGEAVLYDYGEYWWEGTSLLGAAGIWSVAAAGDALPALFQAPSPCSLVRPSIDPSTGKVAVIHSVCVPGQGQQDGIYLYDANGGGSPELLVARSSTLDLALATPSWAADGSGFVFIAVTPVPDGDSTRGVRGLFVFDMATREASALIVPEAPDTRVIDAAAAPDASAIVYCLEEGSSQNLHLIDLSGAEATDTAITDDGASCHPVW